MFVAGLLHRYCCYPIFTPGCIIIIIVGFIERKIIDTNPLMHFSPRKNSPGTDMGQHPKSACQGITKVGGMPA